MAKKRPVLIVDDEKNIRLTLSQSLEPLGLETETAVNGEEALAKLEEKDFGVMLLDLKLPGMDGMEVLCRVRDIRPDIRVIIITAHGTVDSAVEAMKLGAVDFIQKPFAPQEIRDLVSRVMDRDKLDERKAADYASCVELAKRSIREKHYDDAVEHVRKAIGIEPGQAEAFNLLGAIMEIQGNRLEAQKNYRAALSIDPTYAPAQRNLSRSTKWNPQGGITLGDTKQSEKKKKER
ncbi:MAG: response regulator [Planctomycetota bacterium]